MKKIVVTILTLTIMVSILSGCGPTTNVEDSYLQQSSLDASTDSEYSSLDNTAEDANNSNLSSDFKSAMDSYESFMDDYVEFMKKYKANPSDLSLISEYADFMSDYAAFVEDFSKWQNKDLNSDELTYYLDVQTRVNQKLLEVAQ